MGHSDDRILEVENLGVASGGGPVLDGVTFSIPRGRTLALVGESGGGKSLIAQAILRLLLPPLRITGGKMKLQPARGGSIDLAALADDAELLYEIRGGVVSLVFQEPLSALSPVHRVGAQVAEAIWIHRRISRAEAGRRARGWFGRVGLPDSAFDQYPHQLSGGMRQRAIIAMALVCQPELVIADEPTTALDAALRRQVLGLLRRIQDEIGCAVLLITHDLAAVSQVADEVAVLHGGRIVEAGDVWSVLRSPQHPATRALLEPYARRSALRGPESEAFLRPDRPAAVEPEASGGQGDPNARPPLLQVRGLTKRFASRSIPRASGRPLSAVDGLDFDLIAGETFGLVGESGAGKTTVARCILRALTPDAGSIVFRLPDGRQFDLARLRERELRPLRRHAQMVFQDPLAALNPRLRVRDLVEEPLVIHREGDGPARRRRVDDILRRVGVDPALGSRFPHALSGGQRQRVVIARALILGPSLVICDEATASLDAGVREQVLALLSDLQREMGLTYLFISHQLALVRSFCDRVAVMQAGKIVELAPTAQLFAAPAHPYTRLLLAAASADDPQAPIPFPTVNGAKKPSWAAG